MEKPEISVEKPEIPVKKPTILERLKLFFVKVDTTLKIILAERDKPLNFKIFFIFLSAAVILTGIICLNYGEVLPRCKYIGKALGQLLYVIYVIIEILLEGK
jgi:hypothetical protein